MSDVKQCVVCQAETPHTFGTDEPSSRYPVCEDCHVRGKHDTWRQKAIKFLQDCPVKGVCSGNLADDLRDIQSHMRGNARIQEGVCPNGCARMNILNTHEAQCPVCRFVYWCNTGVDSIFGKV